MKKKSIFILLSPPNTIKHWQKRINLFLVSFGKEKNPYNFAINAGKNCINLDLCLGNSLHSPAFAQEKKTRQPSEYKEQTFAKKKYHLQASSSVNW